MAANKFYTGILVIMLSLSQVSNAQITLEHTFTNERVSFSGYGVYDGAPDLECPENSFYFTDIVNNSYRMKIYNSDYSLHTDQTHNFAFPDGYDDIDYVYSSKNLFNTDDNYEFVVTFVKGSYDNSDNEYYRSILYDSNGNIIKDFGAGRGMTVSLIIINNSYKFIVYRWLYLEENNYTYNTEIYSVPGRPLSSGVKSATVKSSSIPYPNPANTVINLPYKLEQGEFSVMNIYSVNGQLVETKQIGYDFDKISLNVSSYAKGMYIYEVNGVSNRFIVQ